jgi:hypothetical protein
MREGGVHYTLYIYIREVAYTCSDKKKSGVMKMIIELNKIDKSELTCDGGLYDLIIRDIRSGTQFSVRFGIGDIRYLAQKARRIVEKYENTEFTTQE